MFTWGDTPPKTISSAEGVSIVEESIINVQDFRNQENIDTKSHKQFVPFEDSEFYLRKAYPKFET